MGFNFFEILQQYKQFTNLLNQSGQDPRALLDNELKRRNLDPRQLSDLINQAKQLEKILGKKA